MTGQRLRFGDRRMSERLAVAGLELGALYEGVAVLTGRAPTISHECARHRGMASVGVALLAHHLLQRPQS